VKITLNCPENSPKGWLKDILQELVNENNEREFKYLEAWNMRKMRKFGATGHSGPGKSDSYKGL